MATSFIFSDQSINLHISPFSIYVLWERGGLLKNREILKKIEKRKTITGNIFSVRAVKKDLVVDGESRKALKDAIGNANIIAEVLNPGSSIPEYLYTRIDYDPNNIEHTAEQIRYFIKDLCERDIESLKTNNNTYLISAKNELIQQLISLKEYLTKEIKKAANKSEEKLLKIFRAKEIRSRHSNFRNGLPSNLGGYLAIESQPISCEVSEPEYYQDKGPVKNKISEDKISVDKKSFIKVLSELGLSYEDFKNKMRKAKGESIINTKDIILRIKERAQREQCPKLELEINKDKKIPITIGTKPGCIFYGSILLSMYEGKKFKRSDLTDVVENVRKKYKEKGTLIFSKNDYDAIPNLRRFENLYKALLGRNSGTFVHWCIEGFTNRGLDTGVSHLKSNITEAFKNEDLSEIKDLLLIQKKKVYDQNHSRNDIYWIDLPIEQVDLTDDKWDDLKKDLNKTKPDSSLKNSFLE